jgi:glycosyltransferase involved in cell wall biosynthesis
MSNHEHASLDLPRISIVTPTFNSAAHLEQTIQSVLGQNYANLEYIIVDGGSADGTLEIIQRYSAELASWSSEPDRGIADAFNKGVRRATGDLVGIINSDDYYAPGTFSAVVEAYRANGDAAIAHGDIQWIEPTRTLRLRPRLSSRAYYGGMPAYHATCFVPRAVYERLGTFNTDYRIGMDYDFLLRALLAGVRLHYLPRVIAHVRAGGISSRHAAAAIRELYRSQREHRLNPVLCTATFAVNLFLAGVQVPLGFLRRKGIRI